MLECCLKQMLCIQSFTPNFKLKAGKYKYDEIYPVIGFTHKIQKVAATENQMSAVISSGKSFWQHADHIFMFLIGMHSSFTSFLA